MKSLSSWIAIKELLGGTSQIFVWRFGKIPRKVNSQLSFRWHSFGYHGGSFPKPRKAIRDNTEKRR